MSAREIVGHLRELYGIEVSPDLISAVTDSILEETAAWQGRPLEPVYPLIFYDALWVEVRDERIVRNKAVYIALGVRDDGATAGRLAVRERIPVRSDLPGPQHRGHLGAALRCSFTSTRSPARSNGGAHAVLLLDRTGWHTAVTISKNITIIAPSEFRSAHTQTSSAVQPRR
jgi:hypothetical protein